MGPPGFSSLGWVTVHGGRFSKKAAASEYQDGALSILKHGFFGKREQEVCATAQVLLCMLSDCLCKALQLLYSSVVYILFASKMYVHVQQEQEVEVQTRQSETRGLANSVQLSQREPSRAGCRPSEITDCLSLPGEAISGPVFWGGGSHHNTHKDELGSDSGVFGGAGEKEVLESVGSDW